MIKEGARLRNHYAGAAGNLMKKDPIRKYLVTSLKITGAIFLIWYLFKSGRLSEDIFSKVFKPNNLLFLIMAGGAFFASQICASARLVFLLKMIDFPVVRFTQIFKLTMIGNFFNLVIPGMVGGDIIKGLYLFKDEQSKQGKSSGIIIMDRALGLFALLCIGGVSILYLSHKHSDILTFYQRELSIVLILSVSVLIFFVSLLFFGKNKKIRGKLKEFTSAVFRQSIFYNVVEGLGAIAKKRRNLVYSFCISIVVQLVSLMGLLVLVNLVKEKGPGFVPLMLVSSVVMLLNIIPVTPGNIGWTELLASVGWSSVGSNAGGEIFFYWRLVNIFCSLPGVIFYLKTMGT